MKKILFAAILAAVLAACSADNPNAQLSKLDELLAKNYASTAEQVSRVTDAVARGKALLADVNLEEASSKLAEAIEVLKKASEADRFNKSE